MRCYHIQKRLSVLLTQYQDYLEFFNALAMNNCHLISIKRECKIYQLVNLALFSTAKQSHVASILNKIHWRSAKRSLEYFSKNRRIPGGQSAKKENIFASFPLSVKADEYMRVFVHCREEGCKTHGQYFLTHSLEISMSLYWNV